MRNRLPKITNKYKICIICEGNEECMYLERLSNLRVWNDVYDIYLANAGGNGNIPARYQDKYQNGDFDAIFVFCDTEKKPHEQYEEIKNRINDFHGKTIANEIVIFGNPCTMQIIIKHWTDESIRTPAKPVNAPLIEKYTGVHNYKGRMDQIKDVMNCFNKENYTRMRSVVRTMSNNDQEDGSTNFFVLLSYLESRDCSWINLLNDKLS